jgi:hypothetical protein
MHLVVTIALAIFGTADDGSIKGVIEDESGFEGAVTVVSEEVDAEFVIVTVEMPYLDVYG